MSRILGAAFIGLLLASGQASASTGCTALSGYFDSANFGYHGSSSGTGFSAGDTITVTVVSPGNAGSYYWLSDDTAGTTLISNRITTSSYTFPANTGDTVSANVNNTGGGVYISWSCAAGTPPAATTTSVSGSPNPSTYGQIVTATATVSGGSSPTGTVTFTVDGGGATAVALSSGSATFSTSSLTAGPHTIAAAYGGDSANAPSSGSFTQTVNKANQTITFPALPDTPFTSTPPTPSATASSTLPVSYSSATTGVCTVTAAGAISFVSTGICTVLADQAGNSNYNAAPQVSSSFNVTAGSNAISFAALANRALGSGSFAVSATASSGLTVSFASLTPSACGVSGTTVSLLAIGTCTIEATQPGNSTFAAATPVDQSFSITQAVTSVTLAASASTVTLGSPVTLTATVSGVGPTGTVTFLDGATALGSATLSGGVATLATSTLAAGSHSLSASYGGDASNLAAVSSAVALTVSARPDPTRDPNVTGLLKAQVAVVQRFGQAQIDDIANRLDRMHDDAADQGEPLSFGLSLDSPDMLPDGVSALRGFAPAGAAPAYDMGELRQLDHPVLALAKALNAALPAMGVAGGGAAASPYHVWVGGAATLGGRDQFGAVDGDFHTSGITFGLDGKVRDGLRAGIALGYAKDRTTIGTDATRNDANGVSASVYASYRLRPSAFLDLIGGFGHASLDSLRYSSAGGVTLQGSRGARQMFGSASLTLETKMGTATLAPYGRLNATRTTLDAYSETGSPSWALSYRATTSSALSGAAGVRATQDIPVSWGALSVTARIEDRVRLHGTYDQQLGYADLVGGTVYTVTDQGLSNNVVVGGIGLRGTRNSVGFEADYQFSAAGGGVEARTLRAAVRLPF